MRAYFYRLSPCKHQDLVKLLVGYAHHRYMTIFRNKILHSFDMNFCIVHTGAMSHVYGKLEHSEAIFLKLFAEKLVSTFVFLGFGR